MAIMMITIQFLYKNMDVAKKQHLQTHDNDQSTDINCPAAEVRGRVAVAM